MIFIELKNPFVTLVENCNIPPLFKSQSIRSLEIKIAVNKDVIIPISKVVANPFIGPVPKVYNISAVSPVVMFASKIDDNAFEKPSLTDSFRPLPLINSSLTRS